jgi:hypothetical protein
MIILYIYVMLFFLLENDVMLVASTIKPDYRRGWDDVITL